MIKEDKKLKDGLVAYIPCPDSATARKIAKELLEKKLVACANIFAIESLYWWEGKITDGNEYILITKTTKNYQEELTKFVKTIHPYEVPGIITWDAAFNDEYATWLSQQLV